MKDYNKLSVFDSAVNGYEDGHKDAIEKISDAAEKEAYQKGLDDAWECARTIINNYCGDFGETRCEIFGYRGYTDVVNNLTVNEAIARIKEYEKKQKQDGEFKVGDEVYQLNESYRYVISAFFDDDGRAVLISKNGKWGTGPLTTLKKTGRHFDQMNEILEKLREDTDGIL